MDSPGPARNQSARRPGIAGVVPTSRDASGRRAHGTVTVAVIRCLVLSVNHRIDRTEIKARLRRACWPAGGLLPWLVNGVGGVVLLVTPVSTAPCFEGA